MANTTEQALNKTEVFQRAYAQLIDGKIGTEQFFNIAWEATLAQPSAPVASQPVKCNCGGDGYVIADGKAFDCACQLGACDGSCAPYVGSQPVAHDDGWREAERLLTDQAIYDLVAKHEFSDGSLWSGPRFTHEGILSFARELLSTAPQVEQVEAKEGWISVKDRLPTHNHSVLGYVTSGPLTACCTDPMRDIVSYLPEQNVWLQSYEDGDVEVAVSHWMPLPPPPSSQKEE